MAFTISLPARSVCSVEIDAVQQRLRPKQKCYGMTALRRAQCSWDAAETFRGGPVGMRSLIRLAAISSGDHGAYVPGGNQAVQERFTIAKIGSR